MPTAHIFQRIIELRAAAAAHAVGPTVEREDAAQIAVVTTEEEVKRPYQAFHNPSFIIQGSPD
jgi:hypothetical protein